MCQTYLLWYVVLSEALFHVVYFPLSSLLMNFKIKIEYGPFQLFRVILEAN